MGPTIGFDRLLVISQKCGQAAPGSRLKGGCGQDWPPHFSRLQGQAGGACPTSEDIYPQELARVFPEFAD